jgi:hypothetical protein
MGEEIAGHASPDRLLRRVTGRAAGGRGVQPDGESGGQATLATAPEAAKGKGCDDICTPASAIKR